MPTVLSKFWFLYALQPVCTVHQNMRMVHH